jgi:hypothetical protein
VARKTLLSNILNVCWRPNFLGGGGGVFILLQLRVKKKVYAACNFITAEPRNINFGPGSGADRFLSVFDAEANLGCRKFIDEIVVHGG